MTPDEARDVLDGTTPGPWEVRDDAGLLAVSSDAGPVAIDMHESDADLISAAPDMAAVIAGMHEEWGVKFGESAHASAHIAWGFRSESSARHYRAIARNTGNETPRIVRRYVTEPEVADAVD